MGRLAQPLAKLSRPRLFDSVPRERLFGVLDGLRRHPLIWIGAPPGAGKTTLVATWLDSRKLTGIWYQIDSGDADPATFFYYLRLAGQPWQPRRQPLPLLSPEFLGDVPGFARRFFRDLMGRLGPGHVLVFDNLHELPEGSALLPALAAVAEEVAAGIQILIVSREEPGAEFARLAANRALSVVGPGELRLTPEETADIAAARIEIDAQSVCRLYRLSAGWAAGLSLILERMRRGLNGATIGEPDSCQEVFDYFAGEIHDRADPQNRQILLRLCFFPHFTPEQAVAVSGNSHAPRLLDYLCRRQLFVERRSGTDSSAPVYQFHALFQAFLRQQAAAALGLPEQLALARTTAELLEARGCTDDAVPLYLEAHAWDSAAQLICRHALRYLRQGRRQSLIDWIGRLPQEVVDADPWVLFWTGNAHAAVDPAAARRRLEHAYRVAVQRADRLCEAQSAAAIIETIFLEYAHFDRLEQWIPVLERALQDDLAFPDPGSELRVLAALVGAIFHWRGNAPCLARCVPRACELLASDTDVNLVVLSATYLLRYATSTGAIELVRRLLASVEPLLDHPDLSPLAWGLCELFVGWSYVTLADGEQAGSHAASLELVAKERNLPQLRRFAAIIGFWAEMIRQRQEEASRWLALMEQVADPGRPYDAASLAAMRAWSVLAGVTSGSGLEAARAAADLYDRIGSSWHRLLGRGMLMWAYVDRGDFASARHCIEETAALSERYNIDAYDVHRHQARAIIALEQGDRHGLRASLVDLFACARRHGTGVPVRFIPTWMPRLCAQALAAGIEAEYVCSLIRAFDWQCPGTPVEQWPWQVRVYTLGRFAVFVDDQPLAFAGRAPKKTLNLLKALVCLGGRGMRDHRLIDAIWPDDEADAARAAFSVTLHRLRKLLAHPEAILVEDGLVSLNPRLCWVDALAFERLGDSQLGTNPAAVSALELYRGNLLPGDIDEPWSASLRERLKARFIRQVRALGEQCEKRGDFHAALELYSRGLETDDLTEAFYHGLMRCHLALGSPADAVAAYRRMRQLFAAVLGIKPSAESERLHALALAAGHEPPRRAAAMAQQ
jgi:LuxR family maltose regulon positive regulatory protein